MIAFDYNIIAKTANGPSSCQPNEVLKSLTPFARNYFTKHIEILMNFRRSNEINLQPKDIIWKNKSYSIRYAEKNHMLLLRKKW
jgi:hypothetical protein